ncbi:MAG: DUF3789 domain-containing protein [Ruminococcus sp.]|nr:DUF3789 domain-containing protein [Ruminococcus sp.]
MIGFIVGFFVGGMVGVITMCLCFMASRSDENIQQVHQKNSPTK